MKSNVKKSVTVSILTFVALFLVSTAAWAQEHFSAGQEAAISEVSAAEIASVAQAHKQVAQLQQEYQARLGTIQDQQEQQKLVQETNEKMISAVRDAGVSVERYNEILRAAQSDPDLQKRISDGLE
jgi:TolA-binding protein